MKLFLISKIVIFKGDKFIDFESSDFIHFKQQSFSPLKNIKGRNFINWNVRFFVQLDYFS